MLCTWCLFDVRTFCNHLDLMIWFAPCQENITLNLRLLRISQFKKEFSYFMGKFKTDHRIRTLFCDLNCLFKKEFISYDLFKFSHKIRKLNFLNWEIWSNLELKAGFHMIATIATIAELFLSDRSFHSDQSRGKFERGFSLPHQHVVTHKLIPKLI